MEFSMQTSHSFVSRNSVCPKESKGVPFWQNYKHIHHANTHQVPPFTSLAFSQTELVPTTTEYKQVMLCRIFSAGLNAEPPSAHSPAWTQEALSWCGACRRHNGAIEPPPSFSGHVMVTANWRASSTMKLFFSAILLITLRVFFVDWNSSERALHAFPPSPCLFVLSPWKLQSFLVKTHNCQRMSCVCVHNASVIVRFP